MTTTPAEPALSGRLSFTERVGSLLHRTSSAGVAGGGGGGGPSASAGVAALHEQQQLERFR